MTWSQCQLRGEERDFVALQIEAMRRTPSIGPNEVRAEFYRRFPGTSTKLTATMVESFERTYPEVRAAGPIYEFA